MTDEYHNNESSDFTCQKKLMYDEKRGIYFE